MAAAIPFLMAGGGVMSAVGSIMGGNAAKAAGDYNANIATQNAGIAETEGNIAIAQQQRKAEEVIGQQTASYGASGVSGTTGSPMDLLKQSAATSAMDAANIRYSYNLKAAGYTQNATIDKMQGEMAQQNSYYSAAGQLLNAGANTGKAIKDNG